MNITMILVTYLHGLSVSEVCTLRWDQLEFGRGEDHFMVETASVIVPPLLAM